MNTRLSRVLRIYHPSGAKTLLGYALDDLVDVCREVYSVPVRRYHRENGRAVSEPGLVALEVHFSDFHAPELDRAVTDIVLRLQGSGEPVVHVEVDGDYYIVTDPKGLVR